MLMIDTVNDYCSNETQALKAQFEAAMIKRIESENGYKMSDLMFEVFCCQASIRELNNEIESLKNSKKKK